MTFLDAKKRKLSNEYDSTNFFLETYNYDACLKMMNRLIQKQKVIYH